MLKQMKLGRKLAVAFLLLTAIAVVIGFVGIGGMASMKTQTDEITIVRLPSIEGLYQMEVGLQMVMVGERGLIIRRLMAPEYRKAQYAYIEKGLKLAQEGYDLYAPLPQTTEEAKMWQAFLPIWEEWKELHEKVVDLSKEKDELIAAGVALDSPRIAQLDTKVLDASLATRTQWLDSDKRLKEVIQLNHDVAAVATKAAVTAQNRSRNILLISMIIGAFVALGLGVLFGRNIAAILKSLLGEANGITDAAVAGRFDTRGNVEKVNFEFQGIIKGFNETLDTLVSRIDSLPAPVMCVDKDFNVQFMNQTGANIIGRSKQQLLGTKCYDSFKTSDCKTAKCACARAMEDNRDSSSETDAHPNSLNLEIAYTGSPIRDREGKVVGAFEFVVDQTAIKQAGRLSQKLSEFQAAEVEKLTGSLDKLSQGDINCRMQVGEGDSDLAEVRENFVTISNALDRSVDAVSSLVVDANTLAQAAVDGKLSTRAEAGKHLGEFRNIIQGVNNTLDAVVAPINEASAVLQKLADKDLTARMTGSYAGDYDLIKTNLNQAADALEGVLKNTLEATRQVASTSAQVAKAAEDTGRASSQVAETIQQVARGANEQTEAVTMTAKSMEQLNQAIEEVARGSQDQATNAQETNRQMNDISSAIDQVARNAQAAAAGAQQVAATAKSGGEAVGNTIKGMQKVAEASEQSGANVRALGDSSKQIGEIVDMITDIAEQTNLLALNAAIEAARAGEHGKGFAVVADEVRKLAERSANATKDIGTLIKGIQAGVTEAVASMEQVAKEVASGASLSEQAGRALEEILAGVDSVVGQAQEVSSAAQQMSAGAAEVTKSVENISAVTQQSTASTQQMSANSGEVTKTVEQISAISEENAAAAQEVSAAAQEQNASVEEMAASASEMAKLAAELEALVAQFRLSGNSVAGEMARLQRS